MWIFLNNAMLSVVAHREKAGVLMVRARIKGDIERVFPRAKVTRTPNADYLYRAELKATTVASRMARAVEGINYTNFKGSVSKKEPLRSQAYSWVWDDMFQLQDRLEPPVGLKNLDLPFPEVKA